MTVNTETLAGLAGFILSAILEYSPWFSGKYEKLTKSEKQVVAAILLVVATAAIYVNDCYGGGAASTCNETGSGELLRLLLTALTVNQATHRLIRKDDNNNHMGTAVMNLLTKKGSSASLSDGLNLIAMIPFCSLVFFGMLSVPILSGSPVPTTYIISVMSLAFLAVPAFAVALAHLPTGASVGEDAHVPR